MALPLANELSTSKHLARTDDKENYWPNDRDARGVNHTSCDYRRDKNHERTSRPAPLLALRALREVDSPLPSQKNADENCTKGLLRDAMPF